MTTKAKNVWIVEEGSYSDYRVVGIYTSAEKAQLMADVVGGYDTRVSKRPLDPAVDDIRQGHRPYYVLMLCDGTTNGATVSHYVDIDELRTTYTMHVPIYGPTKGQKTLRACVWAKDEQHAVKIVNEHRTQMIANGKWDE